MTLIMNQGLPDGHPWKNGTIGFVKRRIVSSENQSPVEKQIVTLREQEDGIKMASPAATKTKYPLTGPLNAHTQPITTYY